MTLGCFHGLLTIVRPKPRLAYPSSLFKINESKLKWVGEGINEKFSDINFNVFAKTSGEEHSPWPPPVRFPRIWLVSRRPFHERIVNCKRRRKHQRSTNVHFTKRYDWRVTFEVDRNLWAQTNTLRLMNLNTHTHTHTHTHAHAHTHTHTILKNSGGRFINVS